MVEIGVDDVLFDVVCFHADTAILTPDGPVRCADLHAGDLVTTFDREAMPVSYIGTRHVSKSQRIFEPRLSPILIKAGALGHRLPVHDLRLSRQHRVLVASRISERMTGHARVLIPAIRLVGLPGIEIDRSTVDVAYCHLLLPRHCVLVANGAPAESLFTGPIATRALEQMPCEGQPPSPPDQTIEDIEPAYPLVSAKIAKKIVAAHQKHNRPLLEALDLALTPTAAKLPQNIWQSGLTGSRNPPISR